MTSPNIAMYTPNTGRWPTSAASSTRRMLAASADHRTCDQSYLRPASLVSARAACKASSNYRNYYVWSDDDRKYSGTRIIFCDTEKSNWTWDDEAKSYYWHRFYSHQPDLNFDNPQVFRAVMSVMRFWLDMGVDGLRLDAPYLVERDGTNNENLPETHAVLKRIRKFIDEHYEDRMLLAEANQWPETSRRILGRAKATNATWFFIFP